MVCRALAVTEGELARAGEQITEYQNANSALTAQADESQHQLQVPTLCQRLTQAASCDA